MGRKAKPGCKRKRLDNPSIQVIDRDKQTKYNRERRKVNKKATCVAKSTSDILNILTEATMNTTQQDVLLQPINEADTYYALNKFGRLMGEQHIPTVYCAVCACKHVPSKTRRMPVDNVPSFILLAKGPDHRTIDITGDWVLLNNAIYKGKSSKCVLSNKAHVNNISECEICICKQCLKELKSGTVPARSLASFDTGPIPESLHNIRLTFAERMFLSTNMTIFNIYRVENPVKKAQHPNSKARVSKGHCISFKHSSTQDIINKHILPHNPETLPKLMVTSYIGPAETAEQARRMVQKSKQLTVRTHVVHLFAREYARMNPSRITYDKNRLAGHFSGTVPEVIMNMLNYEALVDRPEPGRPTFVDLDRAIHDDYAKRDQLRPEEKADPKIQVIQTSGMVVPHLLSNGMDELRDAAVCNLKGKILAIPTSISPVSDYNVRYFVDNYPNIFLHGIGERPEHVSLETYLQTLMMRPMTCAATDYSFPFEARNVLLRQRTLKRVRLSISIENSNLIPDINDDDFAKALRAIQNKEPVNDRIQALLNQLQISGADLRGIPQRLHRYRQQILTGLYPLFGPFDVWITLNMQESSSQVVLRIAGEQKVPISYEIPPDVPNISRRMQICAENPMAVAQFFHIFMKAFLDALLGLPYKADDLTPTHKGVMGWVQAYMFILEVSGKATGPHAHGQIKVKGLNRDKLLERFHDPVFVNIYKQYMLATFTQDLPNQDFDVVPPTQGGNRNNLICKRRQDEAMIRYAAPKLIERAEQYMGMYPLQKMPFDNKKLPKDENLQDYIAKRLIRIVRECGIHEHSATCAKNGHAGDDSDCRMFYPQPLNEEIRVELDQHVDQETKDLVVDGINVDLPRDHPFVVSGNKWVTLALASNTTIYYMPSGREGRTKALYITDYSTKKPLSAYECIALFRASMQAKVKLQALKSNDPTHTVNEQFTSSTIVNRCLNALSGEIIVSGYECCAEIGEFPDNYSSNKFVPFSGWAYMYSMLGESANHYFQIVQQNSSNECTSSKASLISFVEDYVHLDILDENKMTVYEFVAFYERTSKKGNKASKFTNEGNEHSDPGPSLPPQQRKRRIGRPLHMRIGFKPSHKLHLTHQVIRVSKMRVPYQVGRQYPRRPTVINESSQSKQDIYAKYLLSIFKPWSPTMKAKMDENKSWWMALVEYMHVCEPWVKSMIQNMHVSLDRDDTMSRAKKGTHRVSCNAMNHANDKFDISHDDVIDWSLHPNELAELLRDLECEQMVKGMNFTRPVFADETQYVQNGLARLAPRFKPTLEGQCFSTCQSSISEGHDRVAHIESCLHKWKVALDKLVECNSSGVDYEMSKDIDASNDHLQNNAQQKLTNFLADPWFLSRPESNFDLQFQETEFRPNWNILQDPPSILQTLVAWHLTRKQAEFAILILTHFHATLSNSNPSQLLAQCLGAPGTGKSQTLLAILWHMSQYDMQDTIATCAFTGGAAMLISTPYTRPMTTCRQFQITLKGPNTSHKALNVLTLRVQKLQYVFVDEFSFISYKHIAEIAGQIAVALGEKARKDLPFSGMNMTFLGDYGQLSKPGDYPIYYGAHAEETVEPEDMNIWFMHELELHNKKTSYDPSITYLGRNLWTSIDKIKTLTVQKRQHETDSGRRLLQRCQTLRDESFTPDFFDSLQDKAIGMKDGPDLASVEWSSPLYIVMRHALRIPIDYNEARFQANLRSKRFVIWKAIDTIYKKPLPEPLQLIVNDMNFGKVSKWQYYYEGMAIAFLDNKYFDAGNATNNIGYAFSMTLNPKEPPDDLSKPHRMLKFLPEFVLIYVPNSRIRQLCPDLPEKVIPMRPEPQRKQIRIGDDRYHLQNGKKVSTLTVTRMAMRWMGVHAVTHYFSQGMTLAGRKCIIDLKIPDAGANDYSQSVLVMLSRHRDDDDWALLRPLWTPGNALERRSTIENMTKLLKRHKDLKAELQRVQRIENDVTEPQLQKILQSHPELAAYLENAQM